MNDHDWFITRRAEAFWARVEKTDGCWEFMGGRTPQGYGQFAAGWYTSAHRYSWALHNGPIPGGLFVLHRCDNPPCVRPDHLFLGTQGDNVRDMAAKGRRRGPSKGWRVRWLAYLDERFGRGRAA